MSPSAALLLGLLWTQAPVEPTDTATVSAAQTRSATVAADLTETATVGAVARPGPGDGPKPTSPPPPPTPQPAPEATASAPPPPPPAPEKQVWLGWLLSFAPGFGAGNYYAGAYDHAVVVGIGQVAGILMMALGEGGVRVGGVTTYLAMWVFDWTGAIRNVRAYNEARGAEAAMAPAPARPDGLERREAALPRARQLSVALPF